MNNKPQAGQTRATILLVDDSSSDLMVLGNFLARYYDVRVAPCGEKALEIATSTPQPELMLLDVVMPGMDGYEVLARLHNNALTRDIPVIFVSGLDSTTDEEHGLELGAVDYITKPYCLPIILARVHTQLELKHARDLLANQNEYLEAELDRRLKEKQQYEIQLLQSDKLAAIGLLAAGIAHEINNPVGFVTSNLVSLESYLKDIFRLLDAYATLEGACPQTEPVLTGIREQKRQMEIDYVRSDTLQLLSESRDGLGRVTRIVSDLKNFARAESNNWQWADLHKGLDSILTIVWNEIKYHCTLHKEYGDIPEVYCIPSQIDQVFLNLLVNAAQATPEKGVITLRSRQVGDQVCISIADTGTGIAAEHLPRIFDPFFTTKPVGKGTGLGLSIVYGIVHKHGGRIEVESTVGKGTTFSVWLPIKPAGWES